MTRADVLTDEFIRELLMEYARRLGPLGIEQNMQNQIILTMKYVLVDRRAPTFRFVVEVCGEEVRQKFERFRQCEGVSVFAMIGAAAMDRALEDDETIVAHAERLWADAMEDRAPPDLGYLLPRYEG